LFEKTYPFRRWWKHFYHFWPLSNHSVLSRPTTLWDKTILYLDLAWLLKLSSYHSVWHWRHSHSPPLPAGFSCLISSRPSHHRGYYYSASYVATTKLIICKLPNIFPAVAKHRESPASHRRSLVPIWHTGNKIALVNAH
jgi:hypothetical protein